MSDHNMQTVSAHENESGYIGGFTIPAKANSVAYIRHNVARLAKNISFPSDQMEDVVLAVGEAAANALRYGSPLGEANHISVRCECCESQFIVHIADEGCGFDPESHASQDSDSLLEGGRGIIIMRMIMDEVTFTFDRGTTVHLVKRFQ